MVGAPAPCLGPGWVLSNHAFHVASVPIYMNCLPWCPAVVSISLPLVGFPHSSSPLLSFVPSFLVLIAARHSDLSSDVYSATRVIISRFLSFVHSRCAFRGSVSRSSRSRDAPCISPVATLLTRRLHPTPPARSRFVFLPRRVVHRAHTRTHTHTHRTATSHSTHAPIHTLVSRSMLAPLDDTHVRPEETPAGRCPTSVNNIATGQCV